MIIKKCPWCDLVEFKSQGAYNLHKGPCELRYRRLKDADSGVNHEGELDQGNGREHKHEWVLLNPKRSDERLAISKGYTRLCVTCGDILK